MGSTLSECSWRYASRSAGPGPARVRRDLEAGSQIALREHNEREDITVLRSAGRNVAENAGRLNAE